MQVGNKIRDFNMKDRGVVLQNEVFNPKLLVAINNIIQKEEYISYTVNKKKVNLDSGSFLGILYTVDIKGKTLKGDKETNIFIKTITPDAQMAMISLTDLYEKELFIYQEYSKVITNLQDELYVNEDRYEIVRSFDDSTPEAIILENMAKKNFKTYFRMDVVSKKFAKKAIKQLAIFHGLSFVLEERKPIYFDRKIKTLRHPFSFNDKWKNFIEAMCQITFKYIDKDVRMRIEAFIPKMLDKYSRYLESGRKKCLCHGDYRANNILMKEENGEITEVIPIDYQFVYYGCPVLDFIYFIFSSTDLEFRDAHLEELKEFYYETLEGFLRRFNLDITLIYPKMEFDEAYKERLDYGLMISLLLIPMIMASDNSPPDITKDVSGLSFDVDDKCKERMTGIINDFIRWGYL